MPTPPSSATLPGHADGDGSAEAQLSEQARISQQIIDSLPAPLVAVNGAGVVVRASRAVEAAFGYPAEQMNGQPIERFLPGLYESRAGPDDDVSGWLGQLEAMEEGEDRTVLELSAVHASGRRFPVEVSSSSTSAPESLMLLLVRDISARKRSEARSRRQTAKLVAANAKLSALYEISSAVNRTIDLKVLLSEVLRTVTHLEALSVQPAGAAFFVDGDRMRLMASSGQSEAFVRCHDGMKVGDCLCGRVAVTGEALVSRNCFADPAHTIRVEHMAPHGHIVVPLKATDRVVGVLCLYVQPDIDVDEGTVRILLTAGNQIGVAVENARLYEAARQHALHDALTGLANRRLMELFLERNLARAKRSESAFSVIMLDVDHFKRFNDGYGHAAGDEVLVELAQVITQTIRDADLAARYGGEEFLILLPDTGAERACEVAERIRESVAASMRVTVSLGVAAFHHDQDNKDTLVERADQTMYRAKRAGRNRAEVSE